MPRRYKTSTSRTAAAAQAAYASTRSPWWEASRNFLDRWFQSWPLPRINPDIVSVMSLLLAFLFVAAYTQGFYLIAWLYLIVHILLDGLDGAIARKYRFRKTAEQEKRGRTIDTITDRAAEGILFIWPTFFLPWFPLFLLNVVLTIIALRVNWAMILPLRQLFFIVITISFLL